MTENQSNERYKIDNFHAKSLENNPFKSPTNRDIKIYLPPGYYDNEDIRYPTIYFLHGYAGNNKGWTITSKNAKDKSIPWELIPKKILKRIDIDRIISFETLDELIEKGELKPFIFVQPDGSLHIPHKDGRKDLRGLIMTKGSFYVNSPHTGNYMDYIIYDVINYVDSTYRTIPEKNHRALMGGSMGGYGTLYLSLHHPEKFISAVSLSPGNLSHIELLNWKLRIPIYEEILGKKISDEIGDSTWSDILDTNDLIFSNDNRLIPSIRKDDSGDIFNLNEQALQNWEKYDLNNIIKKKSEALNQLHLLLNCEQSDEFGLAMVAKKLHETLKEHNVKHDYDLYSDSKAALTPHILGIGYNILPGIRFCLKYFGV